MSNHKAHFRGDIQVDGSIVGPDGQPVGGSVDVSGLLPVDGSRAMTGPLKFGPTEIDPIWNGYAVAVESDTHDFGDFVVGNPNGDSYVEIYSVDDPSSTNLLLQAANNNYVSAVANSLGAALAVHNDTTFARLSTTYGLELDLQPDALGIAMRDNTVDFNYYRWQVTPHGEMHWGRGLSAPDTFLQRTAPGTLEIDHILSFKGDPSDNTSGVTLAWDQGLYGLALRGRPGSFDGELYTIDSDVDDRYGNLYPGGLQVHNGVAAGGGFAYLTPQQMRISNDDGHIAILAPDELILDTPGAFIQALSPDGTAYKLTPPNGGGPAEWVAA